MTEHPRPGTSPEAAPPPHETQATPPSPHEPPPGAGLMNVVRWMLFALLGVLAVVSVTSYIISRSTHATTTTTKVARYYCPMHPSYTSDRPGECPICGMTLEPIPAGGLGGDTLVAGNVPGLVPVHLTPDRIQMIGVRTARVTRTPLGAETPLVGFVAPDESRLHRVQLRVAGWVQGLHVASTGQIVEQGQPLLDLYSPELYQSEQEFLIERGADDTTAMHHGGAAESMTHEAGAYQASRQRLRLLGVPDDEVRRLEASGTASTRLTLRSPVSGTVLERGVTEGQYVSADTPLFTVADLSRLWVLADLYEMDLARVTLGAPATFRADGLPGRSFRGRVEFVYPTVSNETRTLKVRLSVENPDGVLRPGMYGQVSISGGGPLRLSIPTEAVVNTGEHRYVFLARAGGRFEPRQIEVGRESGDHIEVLSGVAEGDTVVASASFLIDSESRLKAAIEGLGETPAPGHSHGGRP